MRRAGFIWFRDLLYSSTPAEFKSSFDIAESVARLRAATVRSVLLSLGEQSAVGTVTERKVSLQRVIPMVGNSFKPFFIGRFEYENGQVVLRGHFTMLWLVKVFLTLWFGVFLYATFLASLGVLTQGRPLWGPLFGLGMICAGAALLRIGKWFARNDIAWLTEVIQSALSGMPRKTR